MPKPKNSKETSIYRSLLLAVAENILFVLRSFINDSKMPSSPALHNLLQSAYFSTNLLFYVDSLTDISYLCMILLVASTVVVMVYS